MIWSLLQAVQWVVRGRWRAHQRLTSLATKRWAWLNSLYLDFLVALTEYFQEINTSPEASS